MYTLSLHDALPIFVELVGADDTEAGRLAVAYALERLLFDAKRVAAVVDPSAGKEAGSVARQLARAGLVAIVTVGEASARPGTSKDPVVVVVEVEARGAGKPAPVPKATGAAPGEAAPLRVSLLGDEGHAEEAAIGIVRA